MFGVRIPDSAPISAGGTAATAGGCNPLTQKHVGSSPTLPTNKTVTAILTLKIL